MLKRVSRSNPPHPFCDSLEPRLLFSAVPMITEFLASNDGTLVDEDFESSDWIEIHNAGDMALDLDGWHLTDDAGDLSQWTFPDVSLAPGQYLVVFASNKDRAVAGSELHTNFKLGASGEYLALVEADGTTVAYDYAPSYPAQSTDVSYGLITPGSQEVLLDDGADARFIVPSGAIAGWNTLGFVDSSWSLGPTGIGYETTPADYNPIIESTVPNGTTSFYMRQAFDVTDLGSLEGLELRLRYDDGFAAYINGVLVESQNAPAAPVYNSIATGNHGDSLAVDFVGFDIFDHLDALQAGNNVLAIQALNQPSNSDMLMEARLVATRDAGSATEGFMVTPTPGAANIASGPIIVSVTHDPPQPTSSQSLTIEAEVLENAGNGIGRVDLQYLIDFGGESMIQMFDNGVGGDTVAGDGIYTAVISSGFYNASDMVRWYVTAEDGSGIASRGPTFVDQDGNNQSAEYFGTVVAQSISTGLSVFQWFTQNESASHTRSGTRASVFYNGRFYDNVFVRQRGGATNGSESQKFDFNKGEKLFVNEELGSVSEINLNGNGGDSSYIRQPLAFETFAAAGHESSTSFLTYMSLNGSFDRVGVWVEQVDEDFLERFGLDPEGELFKMVQRSNLNPVFADLSGVERKTGDESDLSSMQALIDGLNLPTEAQQGTYIFDNLDLANVINYLAVRTLIQDTDDVRKNFYMYRDSNDTGEWSIFPWDKDWTFGVIGDGGTWHEHLFFGDEEHKKDNANQWNILFDVIFENPTTQEMYLRRLRSLMDQYLQPPGTSNGYFEQRVNALFVPADPHLGSSATSGRNSVLSYLNNRRGDLFNDFGPSSSPHIAGEQVPDAQPTNPGLSIGAIDFNPAGGNQDQEYIQITNTNAYALDLTGWTVEGAITHSFAPGTVIGAGQSLYITPKSSAFRARTTGPSGGQGLFVQQWDNGHLSSFGETITVKRTDGSTAATQAFAGNPSLTQQFLRITEVHYNPVGPDAAELLAGFIDGDQFEFIEFINTSGSTLSLDGVHFDTNNGGVVFAFGAGDSLSPNERGVLVSDLAAFTQRYGNGINVLGTYVGQLANSGEQIKLEDHTNSTIAQFNYEDGNGIGEEDWPTTPDGDGPSLVVIDTNGDYDDGNNWTPSNTTHGTPGSDEAAGLAGDVNGDGFVDGLDLDRVFQNFGALAASSTAADEADLNDDGTVGIADLNLVLNNFGNGTPPAATPTSDTGNDDNAPGNAQDENEGGAAGNNGNDDANNNDNNDAHAENDTNDPPLRPNRPTRPTAPASRPADQPQPPTRPAREAPPSLTRDQQRAAATSQRQTNALALAAPIVKDTTESPADTTPATRVRRFDAMALR